MISECWDQPEGRRGSLSLSGSAAALGEARGEEKAMKKARTTRRQKRIMRARTRLLNGVSPRTEFMERP